MRLIRLKTTLPRLHVTSRIACPCIVYPLIPQFYIPVVKLGFTGVYHFFLFLVQNIDCGYSLEPPGQIVSFSRQ